LPGFELAGLEWGQPGGHRVIALHGWLDNAGSFDLLAPLLDDCHLVALDSAGHGHSGHRSPDSAYNIWQDVADVFVVADALQWSKFSLLAHSRGGAIATLAAGTFPERIENLVLIDGGLPHWGNPADAPKNLAKSIIEQHSFKSRRGRVYSTRNAAILERSRGFTAVTMTAAETLARRSLRAVDGGYVWDVDQRLKAESELRLTVEQVVAFVEAVEAPVLAFLSSDSPFSGREQFRRVLAKFAQIEIVEVEGGHHCHLEGAEGLIAERMQRFVTVAT
jgi:pimeloyl-ACP methyl ester carboxylesterase